MNPIECLHVGDEWGDGPGDKRIRVHRVDPANNRAQFRMADHPGEGKVWAVNRALKRGQVVKIRRSHEGERVAMNGTVLSVQQNGVTLGAFEYTTWHEPSEVPHEGSLGAGTP
ncbi:MAG: hypothetical protein WCY60_01780 [Trueperaceae bacterium]